MNRSFRWAELAESKKCDGRRWQLTASITHTQQPTNIKTTASLDAILVLFMLHEAVTELKNIIPIASSKLYVTGHNDIKHLWLVSSDVIHSYRSLCQSHKGFRRLCDCSNTLQPSSPSSVPSIKANISRGWKDAGQGCVGTSNSSARFLCAGPTVTLLRLNISTLWPVMLFHRSIICAPQRDKHKTHNVYARVQMQRNDEMRSLSLSVMFFSFGESTC